MDREKLQTSLVVWSAVFDVTAILVGLVINAVALLG